MILVLILTLVLVSSVIRLLTAPFCFGRRYTGWNSYGYNPYRYGCRRRHRLLGDFLPILALVALDRIFTRRF